MPSLASGSIVDLFCPLASEISVTVTPPGRVSVNGRNRDGSAIAPRELYASETISVAAGGSLTLEALLLACDYTDPSSSISGGSFGTITGDPLDNAELAPYLAADSGYTFGGNTLNAANIYHHTKMRIFSGDVGPVTMAADLATNGRVLVLVRATTLVGDVPTEEPHFTVQFAAGVTVIQPPGTTLSSAESADGSVSWMCQSDGVVRVLSARAVLPATAPAGPALMAAMGDSITSQSTIANAVNLAYAAAGFLSWCQAFSLGALWMPLAALPASSTPAVQYNRGVSGETAEQTLARITEIDALPVRPRFCSVLTGTNNLGLNPSQTASQIAAVIIAICNALRSRGIVPILCTILPRGNGTAAGWGSLTAGQITTARGRLHEVNRQLRSYAASTDGVILADLHPVVVNYASATGDPDVSLLGDYIHPTQLGAMKLGAAMWAAVSKYAPVPHQVHTLGDTYNATENPYGSMLTGAWGASGGSAGTGTSGTVPSGHTANRLTGASSTAALTLQNRADGAAGREVAIALTGSDLATFRLYEGTSVVSNANFSAGDAFFAEREVDFNGPGAGQWIAPDIEVRTGISGSFAWALLGSETGSESIPGVYKLRLRTPLIIVPPGGMTGTLNVWSKDGIRNGGSATVTRRPIALRKYNKTAPGALTF